MSGSDPLAPMISPSSNAVLICAQPLTHAEKCLLRLLNFFRIPWTITAPSEVPECLRTNPDRRDFCILSSAACFASAIEATKNGSAFSSSWLAGARSAYIYDFQDTPICGRLMHALIGDLPAILRASEDTSVTASITGELPEICGPMSGISVASEGRAPDFVFGRTGSDEKLQPIISTKAGDVFLRLSRWGVEFYLNSGSAMVDLDSPSEDYFDVRKFFFEAVPITMYLRGAFRDFCGINAETGACLIVDDPTLKARYGFLEFGEALGLMDASNFTTTVAFIPWNWQRTNPFTVAMFRQRPDRFSLCIHGCDHTEAEFATTSTAKLNARIQNAISRMESLRQRTGLAFDRIMVFPQGAFAGEAGPALKLGGFIAAVNTEVAPAGNIGNQTRVADLWSPAIMKYGSFPIFTRRYLTHGVENFAFDGLLGKPCLVVAHHDVFRDHGRKLTEFMTSLNTLHWNLRWRSLGDVIRRSFRTHKLANGANLVRMFANNLTMENSSAEPREAVIVKQEADPDKVDAVMVNQTPVRFRVEEEHVQFKVSIPPRAVSEVHITYDNAKTPEPCEDGMANKVKIYLRRYLSEFRDNYLSRSEILHSGAVRARNFLR